MLDLLTSGLSVVFAPKMFILIIFAVFLGTLFGALPGVSATMAVTLGIPFTYKMDAVSAIAFLVAIYCASITGGGMTAILFKIPGVPSSAPTTYDGYPMAQRGEAGKALGVQLIASAIGGMFAAVCMLIFSPQLTQAALSFGPSELFAISFMGLSILTSLEEGNVCRTIISGLLGLLLACIGLDPLLGVPRLTFGTRFLTSGIEMIPVMIGFFAVTEVLKQTNKPSKLKAVTGKDGKADMSAKMPTLKEMWSLKGVIARCSILGTVIGILPGAGATIASFLCYSEEQKISKHPEKFGTGCLEGIAAPESGNNAATGGSMVPLRQRGCHYDERSGAQGRYHGPPAAGQSAPVPVGHICFHVCLQHRHGLCSHDHRPHLRAGAENPLQHPWPHHHHDGDHRRLLYQEHGS